MSLYFSMAVWTSLALASFSVVRHRLPRFVLREALTKPTPQPVAVAVRAA